LLTIWGERRLALGPGLSRRSFLRIGALGGALTLADLLRLRATAAPSGSKPAPPNKSVIMVYLNGGPSHLDTYDLKPDAPREFRGIFDTIETKVPGIRICEYLEKQAEIMDKLAILRAVTGMVAEHVDDVVMSGWPSAKKAAAGRPSLGAVVSKVHGFRRPGIPPFVSFRNLTPGLEPGNLGLGHRPFGLAFPNPGRNLSLARGVDARRLKDRRALLKSFDTLRRDVDVRGEMAGMDTFRKRAFEMLTSSKVHRALDIGKEDARVRQRYGPHRQFLMARRLVQAGVGCVTLDTPPGGPDVWDTHGCHYPRLRGKLLPFLDNAVSALVEDLHRLGLNKDVVVVVWGEFGRTPRINEGGGRDHWPNVMSCLIAGGGLKMGQVIGSTTARGEEAKAGRYTVQNVLATVYHVLGIDPATTAFPDRTGRPLHLLEDRSPVKELV
jgi:hypothetical protein